jgi:hypothetical protein
MSSKAYKLPNRIERLFNDILRSQTRFCESHPQTGLSIPGEKALLRLPVYTAEAVSLDRTGARTKPRVSIAKVQQIAWRLFIGTEAKNVVAATEIDAREKRGRYHRFQFGEAVGNAYKAAGRIQVAKRRRSQSYSLRILQLPPLYFSALWLRRKGSADLFFSLVNVGTRLRSGHAYRRSTVERALGEEFLRRQSAKTILAGRKKNSSLLVEQMSDRRNTERPSEPAQ